MREVTYRTVAAVLFLTGCGGHEPPPVAQSYGADVVVIGDSIVAHWIDDYPAQWPTAWVNAGIGGQTTTEIAARFNRDAMALQPRVVVIEGGVNDLYFTHALDQSHLYAMAEAAASHGACVVLVDILPGDVPEDLRPYNAERRAWAAAYGYEYVRAFDAFDDGAGRLRTDLTVGDGFHLNAAGYAVLAPMVLAAVQNCDAPH